MRSISFAVAAVAALALVAATSQPALAQVQAPIQGQVQKAQPPSVTGAIATYLPVTLWTITGAVLGAVAWPGLAAGTLSITPITATAALMNPGAAVGAVIGGVGFAATR